MPQAPNQYQPHLGYQYNPQLQALPSVIDAVRAQAGSDSPRPWGFHEPTVTAGAGVQQGLNQAGSILSDPRNAWMGLGPLGAMSRFRRVPDLGMDAGGFNVPVDKMRRFFGVPRPNRRLTEVPGGAEQDMRDHYMGAVKNYNEAANAIMRGPFGNTLEHLGAQDFYSKLDDFGQANIDKVMQGRQALEQELLRQSLGGAGGGEVPSPLMLRRFGFTK